MNLELQVGDRVTVFLEEDIVGNGTILELDEGDDSPYRMLLDGRRPAWRFSSISDGYHVEREVVYPLIGGE